MGAYMGLAAVYDLFMDDVPYEEWGERLTDLLRERGVEDGLVLDLGCGTGRMTRLLADAGYDMIGVDASEEMLQAAMEAGREGDSILYLLQDMREFELYGTVRAVVSVCDSLNYLLEYGDLVQTFSLVSNYLDPGGLFLFDLRTVHQYEDVLGDSTIAESRPEASFIWENLYDPESMVNEYSLTLFIREEDGRFRREEESHYQRAYPLGQVKGALEEAGLRFEAVYDGYTHNVPSTESERILVLARECGKAGKEGLDGREI